MKTLRLLLLMATLFAGQLFSQEYPEITQEELEGTTYEIIQETEEYYIVVKDGKVYITYY